MIRIKREKRQLRHPKRVAVAFMIGATWLYLFSCLTADGTMISDLRETDVFGEIHYHSQWQEAGISLPWLTP